MELEVRMMVLRLLMTRMVGLAADVGVLIVFAINLVCMLVVTAAEVNVTNEVLVGSNFRDDAGWQRLSSV